MKHILCTALAAFAVASFVPAAQENHKHHSPMAAVLADKKGPEFDAEFLGLMIHHHMAGAPMWALARERAKSDTILALEKKTTPKEKEEIEKMKGWLKEWHNKTPDDIKEPEESRQMMEKDMAQLKAAPAEEFDALFAEKMAMHHMGAIQMSTLAQKQAEHDELKQFAAKLKEAQDRDREKLLTVAKKAK